MTTHMIRPCGLQNERALDIEKESMIVTLLLYTRGLGIALQRPAGELYVGTSTSTTLILMCPSLEILNSL